MTVNQREACLTEESMERLAQGEFPAPELAQLEEHLGSCERCRSMLESASLDSQWNDEVLPVLRTPSDGNGFFGEQKDGGHDEQSLESLLKLFGPTDDPHKLGRIGTYEVIGVIGRGGMGVVFKAFDAALNRFVAIKMLLPHLAISGAARKRFAREGQAAAAVIDDNVLPIYSVAEWQGVPYLVTQYSRGMTLQKRIQDQGSLELKEILRIGMQTARGLAAAHAQGLVHRDVKPSNILLDGTVERALLTDFGLARAVDDASITRTGVIAGTPQYMSPEQARGGSVDARSDLFGLGCVLYAMCTGRPPFRADNSYAVLRMITDTQPRSIREVNPEIPDWLCGLINRLMAKSPNDRFASATEVATLMEQCLAHVQQPTVAPVPVQLQVKKTASQRMRIGRSIVAIGTLLLGILGLFGIVISFQSQDGTLLIESSVDDVTVKVTQGDTVVRKLTVTKAGTRIDVAAGSYVVEIEGNVDGIAIENDKVNLRRGGIEIVRLRYQPPPEPTRASNLDAYTSSHDVQHIIERTILYVTDVRAAGQVLYFKLHRRGDEPPVNARLKIESHYEKPEPFVWTGPIGADIDVMPGGAAKISLPLIPTDGTKVALIFLDDETAISAAKQLSSIGDRSLLLEQQANLGTGGQKREGVIHGVHPKGGRYAIQFSMVFDSTPSLSLSTSNTQHGTQRPQFTGVNWRPMYLAIVTHLHTAKRHSLTDSQQQEITKLFDEFVRTATVETHDELLKLTQAKVEAVLTREQDEAVRREIWLGWNVTKFRDPKRLAQLQISDKQKQHIDAIWKALELQTGQIQDPSSSPNIPEFFRTHRFAVEGPEQWQRVFDEIYAILTNQQRSKFLSEIQDPIVDGLLTDPRQRVLAVPKGVVREFLSPLSAEMEAAFPTVNWRQLYIGRAMEPQLAKWHQVTPEQLQQMHEISQTFLREATPATRETEEKRAQSAIQALLSPEQDQLLRKEIWLAVNASRLRSSAVHDQLGLDIHQRRQIEEAFEKFEAEVRQNNGWMADGTDSHQQVFDDIWDVLTAEQREMYFLKLQDPVFSTTPPGPLPRDWNPKDFHPRDDSSTPADSSNNERTLLLDVLKQDMERERARFPLLDRVIDDIRRLEGELESLEQPIRDDREQYAKDQPDLANAFTGWQNDFRYVLRTTEVFPELFENDATRHMMVTVARLLIQSEDIPEIRKEQLAQAHQKLGDNPTDELVTKVFLGLLNDGLPELRRRLQESSEKAPVTRTHEDHLRSAEKAKAHYDFACLYCGIENSEMFRQIRKLQESVDPATTLLFEESHPVAKDATLVFISSRGREEVRAGERAYHVFPERSASVTWKVGEQEARLKNADTVQATHVIIDRRTDGMVDWSCYGTPAGSSAPKTQEGSTESSSAPDGDTKQKDAKAVLGPRQYRLTVTRLVDDANQLVVTLRIETVEPQWFEIWSGDNYWHRGSQERWIANLADERSADGRYFSKLLTFTATQIASDNKRLTRLTLQGTSIVYDLPLDWAVDKSLLITAKNGVYEFLHPLVIGTLTNQTELELCVGDRESVEAISLTSDRNRMVGDSLNAVLPQEGIVDLNVLASSTEEAKVRAENRRLRDSNAALLAELQGTWLMTAIVSAEGTIEPVSEPVGTGHAVRFKDSTVALYQGTDQEPLPLKFTIDASRPTPEIDIEGHNGIFTLGLIETQNGTLHLQLGEAGGKRPGDSIKPAVHYQFRRIPAPLVALGEQETKDALNLEEVQQQEAVIREANRQLKDPNAVLLAELQGTWILTGMATPQGFGSVSNPLESGHAIEFDKSSVVIHQGADIESTVDTYVIDASTNPIQIDIKHEGGLYTLGLIELKNGTLDVRLGDAGGDRPSDSIKPVIHSQYRRQAIQEK